MSDVTVTHEALLTRQEVARWLADLASALAGEGAVSLDLAGSTVKLAVPGRIRCEAEVEIEGDEVEVELELAWSTAAAVDVPSPAPAPEAGLPVPAPGTMVR